MRVLLTPSSSAATFRQHRGRYCGEAECDGDGLVLAVLVHVVVHAQLMVGEGVSSFQQKQHAEALVGQALIVEALEP